MRHLSLDIAKGILITLVVIGHGLQYAFGASYGSSGLFFDNPLYRIIYSFHMPLYMIISGYLFYFTNQKGIVYVLKSKVRTIIVPYVTYVMILFFVSTILNDGNMGGYRLLVNEFWFLPSIFINSVVVAITSYLFKSRTSQLIILLIVTIALHFVNKYLPGTYIFMFSCFVTGYLYNRYTGKSLSFNKPKYRTLLFAALAFFICCHYFRHDIYVYTTSTSIWRDGHLSLRHCCIDLQRYTIGMVASSCFMAYISLYRNMPLKIRDLLCKLGKYSLGIYGLSNIFYYGYSHFYDRISVGIKVNYWLPLILSTCLIVIIYMVLNKCVRYDRLCFLLGVRKG